MNHLLATRCLNSSGKRFIFQPCLVVTFLWFWWRLANMETLAKRRNSCAHCQNDNHFDEQRDRRFSPCRLRSSSTALQLIVLCPHFSLIGRSLDGAPLFVLCPEPDRPGPPTNSMFLVFVLASQVNQILAFY